MMLIGFKYVGEKIDQWEEETASEVPSHHFILGAEASYGHLLGMHVRDKDAHHLQRHVSVKRCCK